MADRKISIEILGNSADLERAFGRASASGRSFGRTLSRSMAVAGTAVAGFAVVLGKKSVDAAIQAQEANDKLSVAFKNQKVQLNALSPAVLKLESSGRKLGFTNADTREGLLKLINAGKSYKASAKEMTVAQNLARVSGQSLSDATTGLIRLQAGNTRAAKQYGIVLPPVTKNVDALKKSKIDLTTTSGKELLALAKVQDKLATGQAYYDALSAKVQGQGKAFAGTAAGGMAQFHAQLGNIEESLGKVLLPVMQKYLDKLNVWLSKSENQARVQRAVAKAVKIVTEVVQGLIRAVQVVAPLVERFVKALGGWKHAAELVVAIKLASWLNNVAAGFLGAGKNAGTAKGKVSGLSGAIGRLPKSVVIPLVVAVSATFAYGWLKNWMEKHLGADFQGTKTGAGGFQLPAGTPIKDGAGHVVGTADGRGGVSPLQGPVGAGGPPGPRSPKAPSTGPSGLGGPIKGMGSFRVRPGFVAPGVAAINAGIHIHGPITVVANNPDAFIRELQKKAGRQAASRAGPYAGHNLGLA